MENRKQHINENLNNLYNYDYKNQKINQFSNSNCYAKNPQMRTSNNNINNNYNDTYGNKNIFSSNSKVNSMNSINSSE